MKAAGCPDAAVLGTLLKQDADEGSVAYAEHLESCRCCQQTLADLAADGSTWQDVARTLPRVEAKAAGRPLASEQTLQRVLVQLKSELPLLLGKAPVESEADLDLSFLRPAERPGVLGLLGPYEVLKVIGQGGMGLVLKAFDPTLQRLVAIKVMSPVLAGSVTARRRFTREARAAAAVCHEHIVSIHAVQETEGLPYLVMAYLAGESLQARLDRTGPLGVVDIVRIGMETASGLAAAHAQGLIHRDIKPANILLEGEPGASATGGRVKITDFGLARLLDDARLTQNGMVAGTPEYMAPEQARAEEIDFRADLFSLGSVLYALCTGVPPFRGETPLAVLRQVSEQEPVSIRSLNPNVPAWLERFITRLMARDPAERIPSAAEAAAFLKDRLAHLDQPAPTPSGSSLPWWPALAAAILLTALGAATAQWLAGGGDGPVPQTGAAQEYSLSLRGEPEIRNGLELTGPDADQCVKFGPDGLQITLPKGYPGERPSTGLIVGVPIKGDFEITVGFEVIQEPQAADSGKTGTRFNLAVIQDTPEWNVATLARKVTAKWGPRYDTWQHLDTEPRGQKQQLHSFAPQAKSGRFRMARKGPDLSFYLAEGPEGKFLWLQEYPFGWANIKEVRLMASTGGPQAALEVRFTDLHIRGQAVGAPAAPLPPVEGRGWLMRGTLLGLLLCLLALGAWPVLHSLRRARNLPDSRGKEGNPVPPPPAAGRSGIRPGQLLLLPGSLLLGMIGIAFLAGADNPRETANGVYYDFRGGALPAGFEFFGAMTEKEVRFEPEGLRMTLAPNRQDLKAGGLSLRVSLPEDAEITTTVEILDADIPPSGFGSGAILAINQVARVGCILRPGGEEAVRWDRFKVEGKRGMVCDYAPRQSRVGKLRLKRTGSTLHFLWAEGAQGEKFEEIHQCDFGTQEITLVRLIAETNMQPCALDVRFRDLRIGGPDLPASDPPKSHGKIWLAGALLAGGLLCSLSIWLLWRPGQRQEQRPRAAPGKGSSGSRLPQQM